MTVSASDNIAAHLPAMAAEHPGHLAVVIQRAHPITGRITYKQYDLHQLNTKSDRLAHGLANRGLKDGVRTVLMVPPSFEFFALTFALFKTGAVPVMVDPGMGLANLKQCLEEAEPAAFIGVAKAHLARLVFGWAQYARTFVWVGPKLYGPGFTLNSLGANPGEAYPPAPPGDMAAILFTSGSTGPPKGAIYTHVMFQAQLESLRRDYGIQPGELDLATFPLFALFGPALGMAAVVPAMNASKPGKANPRRLVAAINDFETTNVFGSPALLDVLGRHGIKHNARLPSVKRVVSAGAPADSDSLERVATLLSPEARILPSYGATEALPVATISAAELFDTKAKTRHGAGICVGRPITDADVAIIRITDDPIPHWSDDLLSPQGETGEIVVRGPMVSRAYYNRPEATALAKIYSPDSDAFWHRMGDVGYFDEDGRLWMCGRKSHRVELPSGTLYTICCERIFNTHPGVRRAALVGITKNGATVPVLCVELVAKPGQPDKNIVSDLEAMAAANPMTKPIQTVLVHRKFPVDIRHNSKIFREQLAEWAEDKVT